MGEGSLGACFADTVLCSAPAACVLLYLLLLSIADVSHITIFHLEGTVPSNKHAIHEFFPLLQRSGGARRSRRRMNMLERWRVLQLLAAAAACCYAAKLVLDWRLAEQREFMTLMHARYSMRMPSPCSACAAFPLISSPHNSWACLQAACGDGRGGGSTQLDCQCAVGGQNRGQQLHAAPQSTLPLRPRPASAVAPAIRSSISTCIRCNRPLGQRGSRGHRTGLTLVRCRCGSPLQIQMPVA